MKKTLFILFSILTLYTSLLAKEALPPLLKAGESFENKKDYYLPSQSSVYAIAISHDNKSIISGSRDGSIKIWNRATGALEQTLEGHTIEVTSVIISHDDKSIISGSRDGSIKIWNRATGEVLKELLGGVNGCWQVFDHASSPKKIFRGDDGTLLLRKKEVYRDGNISSYTITSVYPKEYNLTEEDKLSLRVTKKKRWLLNEGRLELNLSIENLGQETYWLKATTQSEYYDIEPNVLSRLGKGEEKELLLSVHAKLARVNPQPLEHQELNITLTTANGSKFYETVFMGIGYANITVTKAEVSEDGETLNIELKGAKF